MSSLGAVFKIVFCPLEFGKPNPKEAKPEGCDTRSRVVQRGTKTDTCVYAAFNGLRERYKAPNTERSKERHFERIASIRRKDYSHHKESLPRIICGLENDEATRNDLEEITKNNVSTEESLAVVKHLDTFADEQCVSLSSILTKFSKQDQCETLYDYLVHLKCDRILEINEAFFSELHVNAEDLFNEAKQSDPEGDYQETYEGRDWADLPVSLKTHASSNFVESLLVKGYGLQISSWYPNQSIEDLMQELKRCGPLCVQGAFGAPQYQKEATNLGWKIGGRDVYGWMGTSPKYPPMAHMITIIGGEEFADCGWVYFIDPNDESDPAHPEKQRVYEMTYKELIDPMKIIDLRGIGNFPINYISSFGYAVCRGQPVQASKRATK